MTQFYTYLYFDPSTSQHLYVGKGKDKRAYQHLSKADNKHLSNRIKKMADNGVAPTIRLYPQDSEQGALDLEIFLISLIGRRDLGTGQLCNHTDGGDGLINPSQETRDKISKTLTGRPNKNTGNAPGRITSFRGKKRSEEFCENLSKSMMGKKRSEESKAKQSATSKGRKGRIPSPEELLKRSLAFKGKPWSEARRAAQNAR